MAYTGLSTPLVAPALPGGIIWGDTQPPKQDIYETASEQQYKLGTLLVYGDGRKFRYAKAGGSALVQAFMCQTAAVESKFTEIAQSAAAVAHQTKGSRRIAVLVTTGSGAEDNDLAEGKLIYNKASPTPIGDTYHILASKLTDDGAEGFMHLLLETPLRSQISGTTGEVTLSYNPWFKTIVVPTTPTAAAAGVPLVAVAAGEYYWSQTGGPAPLIVDTGDTVVVGENVGKPATHAVAGTCGVVGATDQVYGRCMTVGAAGEPATVYLTLD